MGDKAPRDKEKSKKQKDTGKKSAAPKPGESQAKPAKK